jgi:hypothetical protein
LAASGTVSAMARLCAISRVSIPVRVRRLGVSSSSPPAAPHARTPAARCPSLRRASEPLQKPRGLTLQTVSQAQGPNSDWAHRWCCLCVGRRSMMRHRRPQTGRHRAVGLHRRGHRRPRATALAC